MTNLELEIAKSSLWLERYNPLVIAEIETKLLIAQKQILALISETENQRILKSEINKIMNEAFSTFDTVIADDIEEITQLAYNSTTAIMAGYVTADLASEAIKYKDVTKAIKDKLNNPNRLVQGKTMQEHFKDMNTSTASKTRALILDGFDKGSGIEEISRNIRNTFGSLQRNYTKTYVTTSLLEASSDAQLESMDFFKSEILDYRFSSVADTRRTDYCTVAHGYITKDISNAKYQIKTHPRCRSLWTPRTEFSKEMDKDSDYRVVQWEGKTVNHRDGTSSTKFKVDGINKMPRNVKSVNTLAYFDDEYLKEYLGNTRYRLYKDKKATLKEMFNISAGKRLTLEQLNKRLNLN